MTFQSVTKPHQKNLVLPAQQVIVIRLCRWHRRRSDDGLFIVLFWHPFFQSSPLAYYLILHRGLVVFLSCPLVKKHADLFGSFLYSQLTMKDMYSKPANRTELSIPMKTKSLAYIYKPKNVRERKHPECS